ncbi:hypothetical protein EN45_046780 [Penicillium chrysogenum]|uniref:Uncharacterized protein n=1 Tax=Penicillium chrysogenum TaxID=5076 RepID=A0A167YSS8_PENCH|nr:hypothetical protein EN45_046780 [Penicillium chrysogenum]
METIIHKDSSQRLLHKPCETVPEGIEGNRVELLACLSWAEQFWMNTEGGFGLGEEGESEFLLPRDLIDGVAASVRHLVASFDNFTKAHRRGHPLAGTKLSQTRMLDGYLLARPWKAG